MVDVRAAKNTLQLHEKVVQVKSRLKLINILKLNSVLTEQDITFFKTFLQTVEDSWKRLKAI